jgi:hypothetical protein
MSGFPIGILELTSTGETVTITDPVGPVTNLESSGGSGAVSSVFGRTGAVVAVSSDYAADYDALGAASTAQSNAETFATGAANAAQSNAEAASDPSGSAATAEAAAKAASLPALGVSSGHAAPALTLTTTPTTFLTSGSLSVGTWAVFLNYSVEVASGSVSREAVLGTIVASGSATVEADSSLLTSDGIVPINGASGITVPCNFSALGTVVVTSAATLGFQASCPTIDSELIQANYIALRIA